MALSTDDLIIAYNNETDLNNMIQLISERFPITDLGHPKRFLGMRVTQDPFGISLDQEAYIEETLKRFNMTESKPAATPMQPGLYLVPSSRSAEDVPY